MDILPKPPPPVLTCVLSLSPLAQIEYLVREGCIRVLGDLLNEANMVMMALEGLERILQVRHDPTAPSTPLPFPPCFCLPFPFPSLLSPSDLPSSPRLFLSVGGGGGGASNDGREPLRGHAVIGQD
jgi:hypothetical protein